MGVGTVESGIEALERVPATLRDYAHLVDGAIEFLKPQVLQLYKACRRPTKRQVYQARAECGRLEVVLDLR